MSVIDVADIFQSWINSAEAHALNMYNKTRLKLTWTNFLHKED